MIPAKLRKQVMERSGGVCEKCGRKDWRMAVHHIDPKGMGGRKDADTLDNLIYLCGVCHDLAHGIRDVMA